MRSVAGTEELERWMSAWYAQAFRTAYLILNNRSDAEEAVQEAYLRLWRFRHSMPSGEAARPWLFRVVTNSCYSLARREQRARTRAERAADASLAFGHVEGVEEVTIADERSAVVRAALVRLPEDLRIPVVLRYYAGLTEKEIALAIHRRPGTVKSRLHEARQRLNADATLGAFVNGNEEVQ